MPYWSKVYRGLTFDLTNFFLLSRLGLLDLSLEGDDAPQVIAGRYPFAGIQHFAAVVKTHASDINIGVTDMVDVIGVLGASNAV